MKIAVSTSDGKTICGHLGKCNQFIIFEADDFGIKKRELRDKAASPEASGPVKSHSVGMLQDCQAVITQGMGRGMYDGLIFVGILPVITMESDPEAAVKQFLLSGGLPCNYQGNSSCGDH